MKVFKKFISAMLASVICIPSSVFNIAYATESTGGDGYTVTLTDTDNGTMQFSESCMETSTATQDGYHMVQISEDGSVKDIENDGSIWAFAKGNDVEVELIPNYGYEVSSFSIKNAETGNILAREDTTDNVFTFVMPAKNVTVEAEFAEIADSDVDVDADAEENNIVEENDYGQTVYKRIALTDADAILLQERIDLLPDAQELDSLFHTDGKETDIEDISAEAEEISDIYFNELDDNQRAQIDASSLFSTLLTTKSSYFVAEHNQAADSDELADLQDRIDSLKGVTEIAGFTEIEEDEENGYVFLQYDYADGDSLIPAEEQDAVFAEVLSISEELGTLDSECLQELDTEVLGDLYNYYTLGYSQNVNDGIMTLDEDSGGDPTKGFYYHKYSKAYDASFFAGAFNEPDYQTGFFYCGAASVTAKDNSGSTTPFTASLIEKDEANPDSKDNLVRAILYYGDRGDGMWKDGKGIGNCSIAFSTPATDYLDMSPSGTNISGIEVQWYMVTHFALSLAWSDGDYGKKGRSLCPEASEFVELCRQNMADVPEDFEVYMINFGSKYQPIFYFRSPDPIDEVTPKDPFNVWLFKTNNQLGYESEIATLAGAEFTITYYAAKSYEDGTTDLESLIHSYEAASKTGQSPTATFTFETKIIVPNNNSPVPGTPEFQDIARKLAVQHGTVAGIETAPLDFTQIEWENQFLTSSLEEYQHYFGAAGSYHIRETKAPEGYNLSGTMAVPKGDDEQYETTNLQKGVVLSLAFSDVTDGSYKTTYYLNGEEIDSDSEINIKVTNPKDLTEQTITASLDNNSVILVDEKPESIRLWSSAASVDTGTQWVDPDSSNIYLEDEIFVETFSELEAKYIVDTRLFDKTAGRFISFNNGYGAVNPDTPNQNKVPDPYKTLDGRLPEGFMSYFGAGKDVPNSIITTAFNTKTTVEPGQTYEFKVRAAINGDGLAGHTLVFINNVTALNGSDGTTPTDYKGNKFLIYQYPTIRTDTDTIVKGDPLNQIETMLLDTKEMIYITRSSTNIISSQTKRKRDDWNNRGESIIYAGMYLDDSFTSGGGAIKQTLTDTVHYENLQPNRTYYVKGYLVDKGTGTLAADANGTPIQNTENTIKQQSSGSGSGDWKIEYSFDATGCGNRIYVSFVEVYLADELVLEYKNVNDIDEAFYIPEITTKLWDHKTGTDVTYAEETVTVHDTITYRKFMPGTRYKIESRLVNMETGETLIDVNGNPVIRETTKTITWEDGEITVNFEFPAVIRDEKGDIVKSLAGTIFVAYEKIYIEQGSEGSNKWVLIADHEDFWDENQRIYMPYIDTTALDQKTEEHISYAEKNMKLYDTVHYEAVRPEYTYKLVSELRDVATGEIVVDDAGKKQVITTYFKADFDLQDNQYLTYGDVIPENHDGSGITFDVDAEFFAGRTLVVYERMYLENDYGTGSHLVAEHQVLLDEDQTIHVPKVWTSAIDADTFTKTSFADGSTTIIDTFSYENLIPGFTYELKGYVLDKNQSITTGTNVTATGTDGKLAQNSTVFTPESSAGAVRLSFEVDTRKFGTEDYNGMIFVVYEELYVIQRYDGDDARSIVASHTDIADLNQTVYVPRITTNLTDTKTSTKIANAGGNIQLTDTINYYRFQPNAEYVIKGKLLDMETGNVLADGSGNRVEKTVNVTSSDTGTGSWTVDYQFDGTGLAGKIVVAYADVYVRNGERNDILSHVAAHNDFWDDAQRVYIPLISTVATDQKTNSHITYAEENVWITDRISYSFLKPDTEYRLVSKLIDKDTGEVVVDDKGISQVIESDFVTTPNESQEKYNQIISNPLTNSSDTGIGYSYGYIIPADGTTLPDGTPYHGVVFTLDAHTFEGRTLVIYEELQIRTQGSSYMTVATHADIMDENQTVHIPKIRTNAVDSETLTHSSKMDGSMTVIDTVKYENLIPGFTYVLEGYLMDKPRDDTKGYGKIKDKDGNYITNRIEFTPDRPDGEVKLSLSGNAGEFQTDEGAFSSETLVVFERLYLKNNKDASDDLLIVASHEDINDEKQTIYGSRKNTK